jgi:hypothetical protein
LLLRKFLLVGNFWRAEIFGCLGFLGFLGFLAVRDFWGFWRFVGFEDVLLVWFGIGFGLGLGYLIST